MNHQTIALTDLSLDPSNVRKHSRRNLDAIKASLRKFGQQKPIVVDAKGIVLAGNGTLTAAQELGWTEIQIVRTELAGVEATAFAIADNRTAELAEWEEDALAKVLESLKVEDADLLAATGYDAAEVDKMIGAEVIEDEVPEPPVEPITKAGELWILGEHRVLCGDSTKAEDVGRLMSGTKADLCFTSPPYNLGKSVGLRNGARSGAKSAYNEHADNDAEDWSRLMESFIRLASSQCDLVAVNVQMLSGNKMQLLTLFGKFASNTVDVAIWSKSNPQPAMAENVMNSAFEFIWLLSAEQNPSRAIPTALFDRGTFSNVIESATASGHDAGVHGAVFPLQVSSRFVGTMCREGGTVYEPFCGSGTTLIAADQLGRKCYGMEISPQYCDVIVKRWENLTGKKAVLDKPTP